LQELPRALGASGEAEKGDALKGRPRRPETAKGKRRGTMKPKREKLLANLNKDLEWEYAAAIQYVQHAALVTGPEYESITKELIVHSQEEMQHAVMVAEQIAFLGGVPTVDVERRDVSPDSKKMLEQDLRGEDNAISRYKERIAEAEALKEYGLRRILEDILLMEEEHKRDLLTVLRK
jgi:bacterioferritin